MIDRTKFETLTRKRLMVRFPTVDEITTGYVNDGDVVIVEFSHPDIIVASVSQDNLFDEFGNRFSY